MTREEHIIYAKNLSVALNMSNNFSAETMESLDIAIKAIEFAEWVATEIFSDMWEYNKDAFAELAYRKLAKLGIVRAKGDEWELVEPQERSQKQC